ncbi:hypothetical protein HGRIS_005834 [Hohenbuehelia grisea]|uniref:Cep57 centrosome microtubule-binding domain-containing protein n=1 Tax=Hohenbuehelia grisea TaxID=104357 RepID=A0ABR3JY02_9AGAR
MTRASRRQHILNFSIAGDDLEQHRIQLENDLQQTEHSFHLSSTPDLASQDGDQQSLEYPRHAPQPINDFPSFSHRSLEYFDEDHSQMHPWSYRTGDDEDGINPYAAESMSTAAHHASAVTISAGLGGRGRRDISMSGAEYDPDRPIQGMLSGVASKISAFDVEPSRSRYPGYGSVDADPLVVEDTGELDRILQSEHAPTPRQRSVRVRSPHSSAVSDSDSPTSRPKLSDALRHVSFSPKRPRNAPSRHLAPSSPESSAASDEKHSPRRHSRSQHTSQPIGISRGEPSAAPAHSYHNEAPTSKPTAVKSSVVSHISSPGDPLNRDHANTSKFSRLARGLAQEIDGHIGAERQRARAPVPKPPIIHVQSASEDCLHRYARPKETPVPPRPTRNPRTPLHLPDVTGLTVAVDSPARPDVFYYAYKGDNKPREVEERLLSTLGSVQNKLHQLEDENGISRRRIRELEMELEFCKRDVARERTRVLDCEDQIVQHQRELASAVSSRKGKEKAQADLSATHERYKEAVEEKKALEALITTLRTHLTRLTAELSSHQQLLIELRSLRDADSQAMRDKAADVDRLKEEVERLAGEIEVLRGVVEEGLKERRSVRGFGELHDEDNDISQAVHQHDTDALLNALRDDDVGERPSEIQRPSSPAPSGSDDDEEPFAPEHFSPPVDLADRTMATLGSSNLAASTATSKRLVTTADLERISMELDGRRSERSLFVPQEADDAAAQQPDDLHEPDPPSPSPACRNRSAHDSLIRTELSVQDHRAASPNQIDGSETSTHLPRRSGTPMPGPSKRRHDTSRPSVPTPRHAHGSRPQRPSDSEPETPFPQIRGEHLERLFFSAPEHDEQTCTVCHRRRRNERTSMHKIPASSTLWSFPPRAMNYHDHVYGVEEDEDEGFGEGFDDAGVDAFCNRDKGKQREQCDPPSRQDRLDKDIPPAKAKLPPQTILTSVIRELEDDFTHYKSIYIELADQYKVMDAVSNVPKRNLLAHHLREVVDILEQKGNQIASLYELLTFKDKPVTTGH